MAHQRPTAPRQALPLAGYSGHLQAAMITFELLTTGPNPLSVDGRELGHGLPRRMIPLDELASVLMHPSTSHAASDAAWRLLVHRARTGTPAWVVGAVGVAAPGLWNAVKRLGRPSDADHTDVQALVLEGFLQALLTVDPAKPGVCPYLCRRAHNLARARLRDAEPIARGESYTAPESTLPPQPWGHPDFVLAKAVRLGVISGEDADLIGVTRLENVSVVDYARRTGMNLETAWKRRRRAERRLVAALAEGRLSDADCDVISEPTPTVAAPPSTRARRN